MEQQAWWRCWWDWTWWPVAPHRAEEFLGLAPRGERVLGLLGPQFTPLCSLLLVRLGGEKTQQE